MTRRHVDADELRVVAAIGIGRLEDALDHQVRGHEAHLVGAGSVEASLHHALTRLLAELPVSVEVPRDVRLAEQVVVRLTLLAVRVEGHDLTGGHRSAGAHVYYRVWRLARAAVERGSRQDQRGRESPAHPPATLRPSGGCAPKSSLTRRRSG